jgi:hypothetical protein
VDSCQIDAAAPLRTADIGNVARTGAPVAVKATISATFAPKSWCQDEGAMAIAALSGGTVRIQPVSCKETEVKGVGQFGVSTTFVRTAGARDPRHRNQRSVGWRSRSLGLLPAWEAEDLVSVAVFLNLPKLELPRRLLRMRVFKEGLYAGDVGFGFTIAITNDLPHSAKFYLRDVGAGGDLRSDDSVLQIPSGGSDTLSLDPDRQGRLMQQGWVDVFAMTPQ